MSILKPISVAWGDYLNSQGIQRLKASEIGDRIYSELKELSDEIDAKKLQITKLKRVVYAAKRRQKFYLKNPKWPDGNPKFAKELEEILKSEMDAIEAL